MSVGAEDKKPITCQATRTIVAAILFVLVGTSALLSPTPDSGATNVGGGTAVTATAYDLRDAR